jgi:UPF0755 protein
MNSRKTSQGFAKVSTKVLKYVIMVVITVFCATTAYNFGAQIFSAEGMEIPPGTDMSITVEDGTTIEQLGTTLEEYQIVKDSGIFRIQAYIYQVKEVKPGTYTFNTSQNAEEIFKTIVSGPEKEKKKKSKDKSTEATKEEKAEKSEE